MHSHTFTETLTLRLPWEGLGTQLRHKNSTQTGFRASRGAAGDDEELSAPGHGAGARGLTWDLQSDPLVSSGGTSGCAHKVPSPRCHQRQICLPFGKEQQGSGDPCLGWEQLFGQRSSK